MKSLSTKTTRMFPHIVSRAITELSSLVVIHHPWLKQTLSQIVSLHHSTVVSASSTFTSWDKNPWIIGFLLYTWACAAADHTFDEIINRQHLALCNHLDNRYCPRLTVTIQLLKYTIHNLLLSILFTTNPFPCRQSLERNFV